MRGGGGSEGRWRHQCWPSFCWRTGGRASREEGRSGQVSSDQMGLSPLQVGGGGGQTGVEDIVSVVTLRQVLPGLRQTHGRLRHLLTRLIHSHWSRTYISALSLVESFPSVAAPAIICHKEPARHPRRVRELMIRSRPISNNSFRKHR